jgi:hypothetical protein
MALIFLNNTRYYDSTHRYVTFWGHDSSFEVTFRLDDSAIQRISGLETPGEAAALGAFDENIAHIHASAVKMYDGNRDRYIELSAGDL